MKKSIIFIAVVVWLVLATAAGSALAQGTDPISVIKASQDAATAGNVEAAVATWADDAVFINPNGTFKGKEQIRQVITADVAAHIRIEGSNYQVLGDKVTYDFKQSNDRFRKLGIDFIMGSGEAIIQDGKIKSLTSTLSAESKARIQAAQAAAQTPQTLPQTGGAGLPVETILLVLAGGLAVLGGVSLRVWHRR